MSQPHQPTQDMETAERERKRLKEEAEKRWGDDWALRVVEWADGTHRMWAYHMRGRVEDGDRVERDELKFTDDGELIHERVRIKPEQRESLGLVGE